MNDFRRRDDAVSPDKDDMVDEVVDEFLAACRAGNPPSIDSFISSKSIVNQHPDIEQPLRSILETVRALNQVHDDRRSSAERAGATSDSEDDFPDIEDYRLVRVAGRGGMGVVYEAEQLSLARKVALKVLPSHLDGKSSATRRFELEARAAAQMHHTNIVPVFDVGNDGKHCFYAMQFIDGNSLDVVINQLRKIRDDAPSGSRRGLPEDPSSWTCVAGSNPPTAGQNQDESTLGSDLAAATTQQVNRVIDSGDTAVDRRSSSTLTASSNNKPFFRNVAKVGRQIANALHYAHERGIVHRDIKPSNIILDSEGIAWVADFGLAKTENVDLTRDGDVVGTLRYMSPERFEGQCDPASDVYSLGVTLYELLALRSPFAVHERVSLIAAIRETRPQELRSLNKRVPRDLQTIVEKAMEKEPRRRYSSASKMADDLERFLDGRPIHARRVGSTERLWLWSKNNAGLAASMATVALMLLCGTIGGTWAAIHFSGMERKQRILTSERQTAFENAETSRIEAVANLRKSKIGESDMQTLLGLHAAEKGDQGESLLWFAKAAMIGQEDPHRRWANLTRFRLTLRSVPQPIATFKIGDSSLFGAMWMDFHRSGDFLLSTRFSSESTITTVLDVADGKPIKFPPSIGKPVAAAWNANGDLLAVGDHTGNLSLLTFPDCQIQHQVQFPSVCQRLRFTENSERLAVAAGSQVSIVRMSPPWNIDPCEDLTLPIESLSFDRTSTRLIATTSNRFHIIDISKRTPKLSMDGPMRGIRSNFVPIYPAITDSNQLVTLADNQLAWTDLETQKQIRRTRIHPEEMRTLRQPRAYYSVPNSDAAVLFEFGETRKIAAEGQEQLDKDSWHAWAHLPSANTCLIGGSGTSARYYDFQEGTSRPSPLYSSNGFKSICFSPNGDRVADCDFDGRIRVRTWLEREDGTVIADYPFTTSFPKVTYETHARLSPDNRHLLVTDPRQHVVDIIDADSGDPIGRSFETSGPIRDALFIGDGETIATFSNVTPRSSAIELWSYRKSVKRLNRIDLPFPGWISRNETYVTAQADASGKYLAVLCSKRQLLVVRLSDGTIISRMNTPPTHSRPPSIKHFEYPSLLLIEAFFGMGSTLAAFNPSDGKQIYKHKSKDHINCSVVMPKRRLGAVGTKGHRLLFFDLDTGKLVRKAPVKFANWVTGIAIATSEKYAMVSTRDDLIHVIDIESSQRVSDAIPAGPNANCRMLEGDRVVVTYDNNGMVQFWDWRHAKRLSPPVHVATKSRHQLKGGHQLTVSNDSRRMLVYGNPRIALYNLEDFVSDDAVSPEAALRWAEVVSQRTVDDGFANLTSDQWLQRWNASADLRQMFASQQRKHKQ